MMRRTIFGSLAIAALIGVFVTDVAIAYWAQHLKGPLGDLFSRANVLPIFCMVFVLLGAVELNRLFRMKGARPHAGFAYLMIAVLFLTPWFSAAGWLGQARVQLDGFYWQMVWLILSVIGVGTLALVRRNPDGILRDSGATLTMILLLGFLGSFALQIRCGRGIPQQEAAWLLLIILLITKSSDIGAYFVGSWLGRHKLLPSISPKKSVEGTVGGLLTSALVAIMVVGVEWTATDQGGQPAAAAMNESGGSLFSFLADATHSFSIESVRGSLSPTIWAFWLGVFLSVAGQIGDLVESCFKRDAGVKDSSNAIPPFGGILDLLDSPILAIPVGWFLLMAV